MSKDLLVLADEYAAATATFARALALKDGADSMSPIAREAGDKRAVLAEALAALDTAQPVPALRWCDKCGEGTVQGLCRGKLDDCKFKQAQQPTNLELSASDFSPAPHVSKWGAGMMVADVALDKDETLTVFAHKDALHLLQSATLRQEVEAMRHRLSLSFQIRRAIKAEDALNVARKEIKNLNALLNATYVAPVDPQNVMQINDRSIEIFRALHGQASTDIEDSLRLTVAQVLKESEQPVQVNAMLVEALNACHIALAYIRETSGIWMSAEGIAEQALTAAKQAQPERAPLSDDEIKELYIKAPGHCVGFARAIEAAHGIKQGGQHD